MMAVKGQDGRAGGGRYFNIHDRLGSVRVVIDTAGSAVNRFVYDPFGAPLDEQYGVGSSYRSYHRFAGYKWEPELSMYNCNARWYDPSIMRFTGRDPVLGNYQEPLTLHRYLYCVNEPINLVDLNGRNFSIPSVTVSAGLSAGMNFGQSFASGERGWGLIWPIVTGALSGGLSGSFQMGIMVKFLGSSKILAKASEFIFAGNKAFRRGLIKGAFDGLCEIGDDYLSSGELNYRESFLHLIVGMGLGGALQPFMEGNYRWFEFMKSYAGKNRPSTVGAIEFMEELGNQIDKLDNMELYLSEGFQSIIDSIFN